MLSDSFTLVLAFFEGFALIVSPCILPILPLFLASSLTGSKQRPLGLICGFIVIFAVFVFFSRIVVQYLAIDVTILRYSAYLILFLFGIILSSTYLSEKFSQLTQGIANKGGYWFSKQQNNRGFIGGFFLGGLVALIWTPCAGPLLAAVIVQTVLQKTTLLSFFILLAFALGSCLPMFIIAFYGRHVMNNFVFFKTHAAYFRKIIGLMIIFSVSYIVYQEKGLTAAPTQSVVKTSMSLQKGLWRPYNSPEINGIETWLNSEPLTIHQLKGHVILIDFWTYSCINCLRTIPYLKAWYKKYHDKGLIIIGIHSPEFYFEKELKNVKNAIQQLGIEYPVALDNQFATWVNFNNHYWPAHYLIDKTGRVIYEHFGEGDYDVTENNIRFLLNITGLNDNAIIGVNKHISTNITPETYLGYGRADTYYSPSIVPDTLQLYQYPQRFAQHAWGLQGGWLVYTDKIVSAQPNAALKINFNASHVYMVMGSKNQQPITVKLMLNGEQLIDNKGSDVKNSSITVTHYKLYEIVASLKVLNGILQIQASNPGLEVYTFTFGD